jgi:hypothetical protein
MRKSIFFSVMVILSGLFAGCQTTSNPADRRAVTDSSNPPPLRSPQRGQPSVLKAVASGQFPVGAGPAQQMFYSSYNSGGGGWRIKVVYLDGDRLPAILNDEATGVPRDAADAIIVNGHLGAGQHWVQWIAVKFD